MQLVGRVHTLMALSRRVAVCRSFLVTAPCKIPHPNVHRKGGGNARYQLIHKGRAYLQLREEVACFVENCHAAALHPPIREIIQKQS